MSPKAPLCFVFSGKMNDTVKHVIYGYKYVLPPKERGYINSVFLLVDLKIGSLFMKISVFTMVDWTIGSTSWCVLSD